MKKNLFPDNFFMPENTFGDYHINLFYKEYILNKSYYPYYLDEWYDNINYGKLDLQKNAIYPKKEYIKSYIINNVAQQNLNFVSDAFLSLRTYYDELARKEKVSRVSIYSKLEARRTLEDPEILYIDYIKKLYPLLQNYIFQTTEESKRPNSIWSFVNFLTFFLDNFLKFGVLNRSSFMKSKFCSKFVDGLRISLENTPPTDLSIKEKSNKYISDPQFNFFMKTIPRFGFFVDKNYPWTIVFDLNSPVLRNYSSQYNLYSKEQIIDNAYNKAYTVDLKNLNNLIVTFWNNYVIKMSSVSTDIYSKACLNIYQETTFLKQMSQEVFEKLFNINWQLRLYAYIRLREEKISIPQQKFEILHSDACNVYKLYGEQESINYINNKILQFQNRLETSTISLTSESEFYRLLQRQAEKFDQTDFRF